MIVLLAKGQKYAMGSDFPFLSIPLDMKDSTKESLEDYQWWAYSSDFQKWLKDNPRKWVSESDVSSRYGSMTDIIAEHINSSLEWNESVELGRRVKSFSDYNIVLEEESGENDEAKIIKFHYAYNKLLAENKLEREFSVDAQNEGENKAVFLTNKDPQSGESITESLDAYKMSPISVDAGSKIVLFRVSESKLTGPIADDITSDSVWEKAANNAIKYAAYIGTGVIAFAGLKYLGGSLALMWKLKFLRGLKSTSAAAKRLAKIKKAKRIRNLKGLFGGIVDLATLKNTRMAASSVSKGVKLAKRAKSFGAGALGVTKAFLRGTTKGLSKSGAKFIPFVGEVLMAVDLIGSTWNWYSGNQAPRYDEVDSFAKETFIPKEIQIGRPIIVCWSQPPSGTLGTAISFIASNETRTTMELVKIAQTGSESVFILTQINSKEIQKQIAEYDLTLISFSNSDKFERGYIDNDDLDFHMLSVKNSSAAMFKYQGSCPWEDLDKAFDESADTLLVSDPDAPEKYEFNFKDTENNIINVAGRKVTTDELSKYSSADMQRIFGLGGSNSAPSVSKKTEESLGFEVYSNLIAESSIVGFDDFIRKTGSVFEDNEGGSEAEPDVPEDPLAPEVPAEPDVPADPEVPEEPDVPEDVSELTPEQKSGPAKVCIYLVTSKDYANPELRGKYKIGNFTNFAIDESDYNASDGESISVEANFDEELIDPKRGIYTYVKPKEDEESKINVITQPSEEDDKEEGKTDKDGEETKKSDGEDEIKTSPDDVIIKDRKSSTIIRDRNFKDGVNLIDEVLTPREKEILKIENWKSISFAKEFRNNRGDVVEVKLRNRYASFGDKSRKYQIVDGESFEVAKKFVQEVKDRIKYE